MITRQQSIILILTTILIGVFLFVFFVYEKPFVDKSLVIDTSNWQVFTNEEFKFSINYPPGWSVAEDSMRPFSPMFSFYLPDSQENSEELTGPFDHHQTGVTHVSVYPLGIPTEGLFGQTAELSVDWSERFSEDSFLFVLEDGTPFAAYLRFNKHPRSWEEWGFVWLRLEINDEEIIYMENGEEVEPRDPMGEPDIEIIRRGSVNEDLWPVLKLIAESINFDP